MATFNWQTVAENEIPKAGKSQNWKVRLLLLLWTIPFIVLSALIQSGVISLPDVDKAHDPTYSATAKI